ncbi:hypothetical protein V865_006402 [Kwoniella europaea PYCC6329]|uniref:Uncharacterized protein n=1 Tax=Kwoniella europaea PYCC6329 TaxID=1423913 RepID=A0AAX4KP65_9TREE
MATQQNQWNVGPVDTVDPSTADEDPNGLDTLIEKIQTSTHKHTPPFRHVAATLSGFKNDTYQHISRAEKHEFISVHNPLQEVLTAFESRLLITIANKHRPDDKVISACDQLLDKFLNDKDKSERSMYQTYLTAARTKELDKLRAAVRKLRCHSSCYELQFTNNIPITSFIRCLNSIESQRSQKYPEVQDVVRPIRSQFHRLYCNNLLQKAQETAKQVTQGAKYQYWLLYSNTSKDGKRDTDNFRQEVSLGRHHRILGYDATTEGEWLKPINNWHCGNENTDITVGILLLGPCLFLPHRTSGNIF